jgi:O-antigen ligase
MRSKLIGLIEYVYPVLFLTLCFSVTLIKPITIISFRLLCAAIILQLLLGIRLQRLKSWHSLSVLQYLFFIALSLAYVHDMDHGSRPIRIAAIALLTLLFVEKVPGKTMARRLLHAFVAGGTILSLILLYQGLINQIERPAHIWYCVIAGNLLLFTLVATVSLILASKSLRSGVLYASIASLQLCALYLNGTRGAWIAFAVILICIPFYLLKLPRVWQAGYIVALVLAGTLVAQGSYFQVKFRAAITDIQLYQQGVASTSLGGRFEMWKASYKMFVENPILGVGAGNWTDEFQKNVTGNNDAPYLMEFNHPHNVYLEALSTRGLVGMFSLLLFILYPLVYVWKRRDQETDLFRNLVIMAVFAMLISGAVDMLTNIRHVFMVYSALIGIGMSAFAGTDKKITQ